MADPLSGIAIIICIAFGVLTFVLLFIFGNRQIKRFSLKSKSGPHFPIAQDAPKSLQKEIKRRLDIVQTIHYQPPLLKKSDEKYFCEDYNGPPKAAILAADPTRSRPYNQDYRVYLLLLAQSGLLGQIELTVIHRFADLYEAARHGPDEFKREHYLQFRELRIQIQESISARSYDRQQSINRKVASSNQNSDLRHFKNEKFPAVPSHLQVESPEEDSKATYETSV